MGSRVSFLTTLLVTSLSKATLLYLYTVKRIMISQTRYLLFALFGVFVFSYIVDAREKQDNPNTIMLEKLSDKIRSHKANEPAASSRRKLGGFFGVGGRSSGSNSSYTTRTSPSYAGGYTRCPRKCVMQEGNRGRWVEGYIKVPADCSTCNGQDWKSCSNEVHKQECDKCHGKAYIPRR